MIKKVLVSIILAGLVLPASAFSRIQLNDKELHGLAGIGITGATYMTYRVFFEDTSKDLDARRVRAALIGMHTGIAAGAVKELFWDGFLEKGTPDAGDFVATLGGSAAGAILSIWTDCLLEHLGSIIRGRRCHSTILINPHPEKTRFQIIWKF